MEVFRNLFTGQVNADPPMPRDNFYQTLNQIVELGVPKRGPRAGRHDLKSGYPDPHQLKAERISLSAIIGARTYQRARKYLGKWGDELSLPSARTVDAAGLYIKSKRIGHAITASLSIGLLEEEDYLLKLPKDHQLARIYRRLDELVAASVYSLPLPEVQAVLPADQGTPVYKHLYNGFSSVVSNTNWLIDHLSSLPVPDILEKTANSYTSFIHMNASLHSDDIEYFSRFYQDHPEILDRDPSRVGLPNDIAKYLRNITQNKAGEKSIRTGCPFKVPSRLLARVLDEPADYQNALKATFDRHIELLSR